MMGVKRESRHYGKHPQKKSRIELFLDHCLPADENGCVRWDGAHNAKGYGLFWYGNGSCSAHRWIYEHTFGPIPEGLEIDHVKARGCRFRDCVNADHMEAVTHRENIDRWVETNTHCRNGHPLTPENTYVYANHVNKRSCRECVRAARRRYDEKRAAA